MKLSGRRYPLTVIFNLTNRCNQKCAHCYASYYKKGSKNELTTKEVKKIILDLRKEGCLRISFSGGEPLLRFDLGEIIEFTKNLGLMVTVNTNGILISKKIKDLKNVDWLAVSLDGKEENHEYLRGKSSFKKTISGIKEAIDAKIPVVVNMVINKKNQNDIDWMIELAKKTGFKIQFSLMINKLESKTKSEFSLSEVEIKKVLQKIIQEKKKGAPILYSMFAYESVLKSLPDFKLPKCPAGRMFGLIEADGAFWPCPHLIDKVNRRDVLAENFSKIWKDADRFSCSGCYQIYHHEFGLLMRLKPEVVVNYGRKLLD